MAGRSAVLDWTNADRLAAGSARTAHSSIPAQQALMKAARLPAIMRAQAEAGDVAPPLGGQAADAADLDGDGARSSRSRTRA